MRPLFCLGLKQFWANKWQSLIIILLVLFSSLLLATGLGLLFNHTPLIKELTEKNTPELHLVFSGANYHIDELTSWWEKEKGVKEVEISPILTNGEISVNNLSAPIELSLITKQGANQVPLPGQVWVPTNLATAENIQLGDYLVTKGNHQKLILEVTKIIVEPFYSESPLSFKRIWLNNNDFDKFLRPNQETHYTLSIQFDHFSRDYQKIWQAFSDYLPASFNGSQRTITTVAENYQTQFRFSAKCLFIAGMITLLITSYLIYFKISYAVLTKHKQLATYRLLGFSTWQLRLIFLSQFSCAGIIGLSLGLSLSTISLSKICLYLLKNLRVEELNLTYISSFSLTFMLILVAIFLSVYLATRKIKALSPLQALRAEQLNLSLKNNKRHALTSKPKQTFSLLLEPIRSKWQHFRASIVIITLGAFIFCFSLNLANSLDLIGANRVSWGYNEGDLLLKINQPDQTEKVNEILAYLRKKPDINSVVALNFYPNITLEVSEGNDELSAMGFFGSLEKIGQTNLVGKHPLHETEISLAQTTAKKINKGLGDTLVLSINDQTSTFKITGIFQSLTNGGEGVRLVDQNILDADPYFSRRDYYLKTPHNQLTNLIDSIEKEFPHDVTLFKVQELVQQEVAPFVAKLKRGLLFFSGVAFWIILLTVFSSITLKLNKDRYQLSLLNMIGVSHWELLKTQLIQLFSLTIISSTSGIILALIFSKPLLSYFFSPIGISQFPLTISIFKTCLIIPFCLFSVLLGAAFPLSKIKKINLREIIKQ